MSFFYRGLMEVKKWLRPGLGFALNVALNSVILINGPRILSAQTIEKTSVESIQKSLASHPGFIKGATQELRNDLFGNGNVFIENAGQFGDTLKGCGYMGAIRYSYDGFDMPVLITARGLIFLQRKISHPTEEQKEEMKRKGMTEEEIEGQVTTTECVMTLEWADANMNAELIAEDLQSGYFTYGMQSAKARTFKKITCKDVYPAVDVEFYFPNQERPGFEYNMVLKPGADISSVKLKWGGDVARVQMKQDGSVRFKSALGAFDQSAPECYYSSEAGKVILHPQLKDRLLTFHAAALDPKKTLVIDPFISSASNLTGTNTGKAKDVDFDYDGNVYVTGGGDGNVYQLAKYNSSGVWQWTFNGTLSIPSWTFGTYYGGWVVEKTTGSVYLGQGFNPTTGFKVIRINTNGLYDNYITTPNSNFLEDWKMYWSCNSGSPQILIAGGGTNSNNNFAVCTPPSTILTPLNVTGIPYSVSTGWAQDIADIIIDPVTSDMYTIYGSLYGTPSLSNKIYKNPSPYSGGTVAWNATSGFTVIQEIANRPYMTGGMIENSCNVFAINSSYLFYWDGKNLKAINKTTGAGVGTSLTVAANTALWSGGIIADECNHVFVGSTNGTIKVYLFNGSAFDDAAAADISITGYSTKSVYDLAYDEAKTLLYASGDGFVASFNVSTYSCPSTSYTLSMFPDCATASVTSSISPSPPPGSTVTYELYIGANLVNSNSTGTFTGLTPGITYTMIAYVNQICSGTSTTADFTLPGPALTVNSTNTDCGASTGTISASGSGGSLPYSFSIDGVTFQGSGNFTGLGAGVYPVTVKDASGCSTTDTITIINSNGPSLTFSKTDASCSISNGTITANGTGGTPPLQYSIDGSIFQANNFFTGLSAGTYVLTVKDVTGCINEVTVTIGAVGGPSVTATPAATYCNTNNGSITAFATGGSLPLQYSLDGNNYQSSNVFTGLAGGTYTVTVKDANGCLATFTCTVANSTGPTVTASTTSATCGNSNGTITASGSGGTLPLQYSINGITFQSSSFFGGLTAGSYTVSVKDANGCTSTVTVTVSASNAPAVTATTTSAACNTSTGTITASGSGGTAPLTYSINGFTFQSSGFFSGLAPGTYTVLVKDANGCYGATTVTVTNTAGPSVSAVTTPTSCGADDGVISATGSGGTAPLTYSIDGSNFQGSGVFNSLATGSYTITVKDANGCISTVSVVLTNASGLSLSASSISTPCSGNNGSITAIASGGVGSLQYSIDGITYQSNNQFSNVAAGNYTVTVMDVNGCTATTNVVVGIVFAPTVSVTTINANCNSDNGTINATGSGGTSPYEYSMDGSTFQSSGSFTGIAPGTYTVTVMDAAGCTGTAVATVSNVGSGPAPDITVLTVDDVPCVAGDQGEIKVTGTGGTGPYTYSINGGPYDTENEFDISTPGTYTVTVKDANGCTASVTVTVGAVPGPTVTLTITNSVCGSSTGSIVAVGSGDEPPFKYKLNSGTYQSSGSFTGLAPGTYTVTVKDNEGCTGSAVATVLSTGGPSVTLNATNPTCGLSNGTIIATGSGGTAPLTYNLNNGSFQSSGTFTGLGPGTYTILVKDAAGCLNAATVTFTGVSLLSLSAAATGTSCGQVNGSITAQGSGGTAPLQYSINGTIYQSSGDFSGLASGNYTVWMADASGCITTTTVTVPATTQPVATAYSIGASCGNNNGSIVASVSGGTSPMIYSIDGVTFQSSNTFSGLGAGAYTLTVQDANGCVNATTVNVGNISGPSLSVNSVSSKCGNANGSITGTGSGGTPPLLYSIDGTTFQSSGTFTNVTAGTYTVTVQDNNGCIATKLVDVANVAGPSALTSTVVNTTCGSSNGQITASASGGTAPLQYSIDGVTFQGATTFNSLSAGTYTVWVKDANGCTKTVDVTIVNLEGPNVAATPSPSSCFNDDGAITAIGTGGTGSLTYSIDGITFQSNNIFTGLAEGTYTVTTMDANGCTATATASVSSIASPSVSASTSSSMCGAGTITASAVSGTPPYQFSIDGINFQSSNVFTCLADSTYTITVMDANGCMDTIVIVVSPVLPITLLNFSAEAVANMVLLNWTTASEFNSDFFTVEKMMAHDQFLGFQITHAAGFSVLPLNYSAMDVHPWQGTNYYRLKLTDLDGHNTYSDLVSVYVEGDEMISINPNPFGEHFNMETNETLHRIRITDMLGNRVFEMNGNYTGSIRISLVGMASGCYMLEGEGESGFHSRQLIVKSRNDGY
jgi:hypothetical protein